MKYLKTFEAYGQSSDIHEDIAVSILAELKKLQAEKGYYTGPIGVVVEEPF